MSKGEEVYQSSHLSLFINLPGNWTREKEADQ